MRYLFHKLVLLAIALMMVLPSVSVALRYDASENQAQPLPSEVSLHLDYELSDLSFSSLNGFDVLNFKDAGYLDEPGHPALPYVFVRVALPFGMQATDVVVEASSSSALSESFTIYPAQYPIKASDSVDSSGFVDPDPAVYGSNEAFPGSVVTLLGMSDLAGQGFAELAIYPFQYQPVDGTIEMISSLDLSVVCEEGYVYGDYLSSSASQYTVESLRAEVEEMVVNPMQVSLNTNPDAQSPTGVSPGDYEYVIITRNTWMQYFSGLSEWRMKKGMKSTIVSLDWIYYLGGYSGSDAEKIRQFIEDAYTNWGTTYVLLGGDADFIPTMSLDFLTVDDESVPSDTWYADFDDDFICEVNIGRASVNRVDYSAGGISNFLSKILVYESSPPLNNYVELVGLFGFDLDNATQGELVLSDIQNSSVPTGWDCATVFDSDGGNHKDTARLEINAGRHLFNHIDHSSQFYLGVGSTNHNWYFSTAEIEAFYNDDRQGIWYTMGCWSASFDTSNCVGERYVRNPDGGGLAFIGNSRYGWYYSGDLNSLSMRFSRSIFESLLNQGHYRLGDAFSDHKHDAMLAGDTYEYLFHEITLLGDPALDVWTQNPLAFNVSHPDILLLDQSNNITVFVGNETNVPVDNAMVTLYASGDTYLRGVTNASGLVSFEVIPSQLKPMSLTASKHNYIPYSVDLQTVSEPVADAGGPYVAYQGVALELDASDSYDEDGDIVSYQWDFENDGVFDFNSTDANVSRTFSVLGNYTLRLRVTDDAGLYDEDLSWVSVEVPPPNIPPTADAGGPYEQYANMSVEFDASGSSDPDGVIVLYEWDFENDGIFEYNSTNPLVSHIYELPGNYSAALRVWDDESENDTDVASVTINVPPPNDPPVADCGGPYNVTIDETSVFDGSDSYDPDGGIVLYEWDFDGDGTYDENSTFQTVAYSYSTLGNFSIRLRVTDNFGLKDVDTSYVVVNPPPANRPPNEPTAPSPVDGALEVSADSLELSWECDDPDGDSLRFDVYLGSSLGSMNRVSQNQSGFSYTTSSLNYLTIYYWKVVAYDPDGLGTSSPIWQFTTMELENDPPVRPTVSGPAEGRINQPLQYSIFSSDIDGDAIYYYVEWGDGSIETWIGPYASGDDVVVSHIYTAQGTYAIRVRARDIHGAVSEWKTLSVVTAYVPDNPWLDMMVGWLHELAVRFPIFDWLLSLPFFANL